jgi:hypothetical protein
MTSYFAEERLARPGKAGIEIRSNAMFDMFEAKLKTLARQPDTMPKPTARQVSLTGKEDVVLVKRRQPNLSRSKRLKLVTQVPLTNYTRC